MKDVNVASDLRRLKYFKAVAEELHFRRTAETLDIAQPALSRHIHELEQELGVQLFVRDRRRVALTDAGVELLASVDAIIEEFDRGTRRAQEAQAGRRGFLKIGAVGMVMVRHLPAVVQSYRKKYPAVSLDIQVFRSTDLREALSHRHVQLAFTTGFEPDDVLSGQHLWDCSPRVVLPRAHPMAQKKIVRLNELNGETLLVYERRAYAYREVMALCYSTRFAPGRIKPVSPVAELETFIGMVACGLGVTILPSPLEQIKFPSVAFKPIATKQVYRIAACWRTDNTNPLVDHFVEAASELVE